MTKKFRIDRYDDRVELIEYDPIEVISDRKRVFRGDDAYEQARGHIYSQEEIVGAPEYDVYDRRVGPEQLRQMIADPDQYERDRRDDNIRAELVRIHAACDRIGDDCVELAMDQGVEPIYDQLENIVNELDRVMGKD